MNPDANGRDPSSRKRLTITFDNGPDPACTPYVLDILRERSIRSTFFVCAQGNALHGAMPAALPEGRSLLERIRNEGHQVGNHTLTHTVELGTSNDESVIAREIGLNQTILQPYNDQRLFRPYMAGGILGPGSFSPQAVDYLARNGYEVVLFNSCPRDWEQPETWPDLAKTDVERLDWTVMIVHDVSEFRGMLQLERFLDEMLADGIEFTQEFNPECVPIRNGLTTPNLDGLVCGDKPEAPRPLSLAAIPLIHHLPQIGLCNPSRR